MQNITVYGKAIGAMKKSLLLSFTSSAFQALPGEDSITNPGVYGRALASWLSSELRYCGFSTDEVIPEDFGWCVPVMTTPQRTYVACANADVSCKMWNVFVFSEDGLLSRLIGEGGRCKNIDQTFSNVHSILLNSPIVMGVVSK